MWWPAKRGRLVVIPSESYLIFFIWMNTYLLALGGKLRRQSLILRPKKWPQICSNLKIGQDTALRIFLQQNLRLMKYSIH